MRALTQTSRAHFGLRTQRSILLPSCRTMTSLAPSFNSRLASVRPAPAAVGDGVGRIQTPALILDKGALLANLRRLPALVRESSSGTVRIRPHFKAHKCGAIAKLQLEEGEASGFCFQKVSEMEPLIRFFEEESADSGKLLDLLVTNEVVERSKLRRLCELASHPSVKRVGVAVDDAGVLQVLMDEARAASGGSAASRVGVVIEIDVGQQRCGIDIASQPGEEAFVALARHLIAAHRDPSGHVSFIGLQAYHGGNQHVRAAVDRERTVQHVAALARKALDLLRANDCLPEGEFLVSGGGTGSFPYEIASGVYNEIQPGSYALMDRDYCLNKNAEDRTESPFKNSMFVLSTVISTASAGRGWVTLDAGLKAYAVDSGLPVVWQNDELDCEQAGDEHTKLIPRTPGNLAALAHFKVGDRVWLVPGHCDPTSNLYDWMVAVQEDKVTDVWAVSARGPGM